jgi:DNA repair exonuclease SbcCD nuclease subunit
LLHLSDVHFGNEDAANNEAYLSGHLDGILNEVDRVVITGDLFNAPQREQAIAFRNFRASLHRRTKKNPIVIPGNHDQKWMGNFGSPLGELSKLEWSSLVCDDDLGAVFFCFDSSRDADLARGRVTKQQMLDVATQFVTECSSRREIENYLPIALVHHHPFSFETSKETLIARGLAHMGITDELFLRMDDAESFIAWCARRAIPLILHGHKHVPRYVKQAVSVPDSSTFEQRDIVAVGCGSSLGAESKPLSYNLLSWDCRSKRWSIAFFADHGDGSGFSEQLVAQHSVPELRLRQAFDTPAERPRKKR